MLQRGHQVPHFDVTRRDASRFRYSEIWQRRNLLLVLLPAESSPDCARYEAQLAKHAQTLTLHNAESVISSDPVAGLRAPGVLIADRWGEVCFAHEAARIADLPSPEELIEWLEYVQHQCPECEGEAR
jgi:peroxiredoxin